MSRPGIYTFTWKHVKMHLKIFLGVFWGFYSEGCTGSTSGRARCLLTNARTKMAETLTFLREFRSLNAGPAAHPELLGSRPLGTGNFFGSFREFLRSFGEFGFVSCAPGAGRLAGKLSTAYPQLSLY